jgi:hypothetical protein
MHLPLSRLPSEGMGSGVILEFVPEFLAKTKTQAANTSSRLVTCKNLGRVRY